jgi:hypothetical protein
MPLMTIGKCFRGRSDCESFDVIEATPDNITEEQMETLDFKPTSFVCCGCIRPEARNPKQDAYRLCFKTAVSDDMADNDEQDLVHLVKVATTALAVIATRRVHRGYIDVPTSFEADTMMSVNTRQGVKPA